MLALTILTAIADDLRGRRMSFREFCSRYLRHHFPLVESALHKDLKERLESLSTVRGVQDNWRAPRGNAKSTIVSLAYPLYCVCFGIERYIVLVSDTHTQSKQFLSDIKLELEQNEDLKQDFPLATKIGSKWATEEIITGNNIMITALGMRGKIRGRKFINWRPTLILIDDPENDESVLSPRQRERTRTWLEKGAMKAGVTGYTNVVIVGTVLNGECLVEYLSQKSTWRTKTYSSIREYPKDMDLWDEWEAIFHADMEEGKPKAKAFYLARKARMDEGAVVLWPHRETLYDLMCMRAEDKLVFESEKQNSAVNPTSCRFPGDWFDDIWYDELPKTDEGWNCFGFCDPSVGRDNKRNDYSAIVWAYWRRGHRFLYIDAFMARMPSPVLVDEILRQDQKHDFKAFGFEINGYQINIAESLSEKSAKLHTHLPVVLVNHVDSKQARIMRLAPHLQAGNLKFRRGTQGSKLLVRQLSLYGVDEHDDGPDALEGLVEIIRQSNLKKNR